MITSITNSKIKELIKLKQKKYRQETNTFLVEGSHLVEEAIKAKQAKLIITSQDITRDIETLYVSKEVMAKLSFTDSPQGIMALCSINKYDFVKDGKSYLLLENIQDPGNLGTLIRTALGLGIDQVIMSPNCVDLYNDKVLRSMQGANFMIPIISYDLVEAIKLLKKQDVLIYGTSLHNGKDINSLLKPNKWALILGNEGNGMSSKLHEVTDYNCFIPISKIESLNVAIAGAIAMFYFNN